MKNDKYETIYDTVYDDVFEYACQLASNHIEQQSDIYYSLRLNDYVTGEWGDIIRGKVLNEIISDVTNEMTE